MQQSQFPEVYDQYPRVPLLWPFDSPLERLDHVSNALHNDGVQIWMKRDDCGSGLGLGGNKLRALEYIFADLLEKGCDVAVCEGGTQSNCMRLVAAVAAKVGVESRLIQRPGSVKWNEPKTSNYLTLGNVQIANIISSSYMKGSVTEVIAELEKAGKKPYHIPAGGWGIPVGGLGYARIAFEIVRQEQEQGVFFDTIVLPVASGTTTGGVVAGFRHASKVLGSKLCPTRRIIAVFTGADPGWVESHVMKTIFTTASLLYPDTAADEPTMCREGANLGIDFEHAAGGHGHADNKTIEAMRWVGSLEGIILDPAYTGKAFACLLDKIRTKDIKPKSKVLFIHTGGAVALGAYSHLGFCEEGFNKL